MPTFLPPLPSRGEVVDVVAIRRDCAAVRRMFKIEEGEPLEGPEEPEEAEEPEELEVLSQRAAVWGSGMEHRFQGERSASGMRPPPPNMMPHMTPHMTPHWPASSPRSRPRA